MTRLRLIDPPERVPASDLEFLRHLGGPVCFEQKGRDSSRRRAVGALLHGNEPSGLRAVHAWLRSGCTPAVDTVFFIGAVDAALLDPPFSHRMPPERRDLNRCFKEPYGDDLDGRIAAEVMDVLMRRPPESLVDIHNNTGRNPPYGILRHMDDLRLTLASLFADTVMASHLRLGTFAEALDARDIPTVAVECGRAGDPEADSVGTEGLARYLEGERHVADQRAAAGVRVLVEPIRVHLRPGTSLAFAGEPLAGVDVTLKADLDRHNFERVTPGTVLGWVGDAVPWPLEAVDKRGVDVSGELFEERHGRLLARLPMIPVMVTTSAKAALIDCLFYLVQERPS